MLRSDERILTTHCGSLPRPPHLSDLLLRQEAGEEIDEARLQRESAAAVTDVLARQLDAGVDIVSDGEQPRVGFSMYVPQRMTGFGGESIRPTPLDLDEFPLFAALRQARAGRRNRIGNPPNAIGPVQYVRPEAARRRMRHVPRCARPRHAQARRSVHDGGLAGIIATTMVNQYYHSYEPTCSRSPDELRNEYEIVVSAGFVLQLDAPDLGLERARMFKHPARPNSCTPWTSTSRPSTVPSAACRASKSGCIAAGATGKGRTSTTSRWRRCCRFLPRQGRRAQHRFANPRHQHEYAALRKNPLPPDVILIPGVIDPTTNFVEHPEVVANRICEAVTTIGDRSRVIAGRIAASPRRLERKPSPPMWCGRSSKPAARAPISRPGGCGVSPTRPRFQLWRGVTPVHNDRAAYGPPNGLLPFRMIARSYARAG